MELKWEEYVRVSSKSLSSSFNCSKVKFVRLLLCFVGLFPEGPPAPDEEPGPPRWWCKWEWWWGWWWCGDWLLLCCCWKLLVFAEWWWGWWWWVGWWWWLEGTGKNPPELFDLPLACEGWLVPCLFKSVLPLPLLFSKGACFKTLLLFCLPFPLLLLLSSSQLSSSSFSPFWEDAEEDLRRVAFLLSTRQEATDEISCFGEDGWGESSCFGECDVGEDDLMSVYLEEWWCEWNPCGIFSNSRSFLTKACFSFAKSDFSWSVLKRWDCNWDFINGFGEMDFIKWGGCCSSPGSIISWLSLNGERLRSLLSWWLEEGEADRLELLLPVSEFLWLSGCKTDDAVEDGG